MKIMLKPQLLCLALLGQAMQVLAQGNVFTYQGRLADTSGSANGSYDMRFVLYDAASGGNAIGLSVVVAPLVVSNGLFTAQLDFGSAAFPGADRWLEIGVRTNGSVSTYTYLAPRQALTPTPYAMLAGTAASVSATNLTGTVSSSQLPANVARLDANETFTGQVNFNGGNVGIGTAQPVVALDVVRPNETAIIRLARSDTRTASWYLGAGRMDNGEFTVGDQYAYRLVVDTSGNIGIGTTSPSAKLDVSGTIHAQASAILGDSHWTTEGMNYTALSTFGGTMVRGNSINVGQFTIGSWNQLAQPYGLWVGGNSSLMGNVGIGTTNPLDSLDIIGGLTTRRSAAQNIGGNLALGAGNYRWLITGNQWNSGDLMFRNPAGQDVLYFSETGGNVGIGTTSPTEKLSVAGVVESTTGGFKFPDGSVQITASAAADSIGFNVKDYGAVGDGTADDTAAFKNALSAAANAKKGSKVVVSPGRYRITDTLTVNHCLLTGLDCGGWPADEVTQPRILVEFTSGPCVLANAGASINGLRFVYSTVTRPPTPYPPTISLNGIGITINNIQIDDADEGIIANEKTNIGRINIENVFIVNPITTGVYITGTQDASTVRNVEVFCTTAEHRDTTTGFKLGQNDEIRLSQCFVLGCMVGYKFIADAFDTNSDGSAGVTWGGLNECSSDSCKTGMLVRAARTLRVSGGSHWSHMSAIQIMGQCKVVLSGIDMKANALPCLFVQDCETVTVSGCLFGKAMINANASAVQIVGGTSVLINACNFDSNGPGIQIGSAINRFSITGNVFESSPYTKIQDNSTSVTKKVIASNLTD